VPSHRNKSRLRFHPFNPRANFRKIVEGKSAFVGDVCVSEQCDVGDRVVLDEEILLREMLLYDFERGQAAVAFSGERRGALRRIRPMLE
jgi:hypothetical protein